LLDQIAAPMLGYIIKKRLAELAQMEVDEIDMLMGHSRPERKGRREYRLPRESTRPASTPIMRKQIRDVLMNPEWALAIQIRENEIYEGEMAALVAIIERVQASEQLPSCAVLAEGFRHTEHESIIDSVLQDSQLRSEEFINPNELDRENFILGFDKLMDRYDDELVSTLSNKGYEHLSQEELQLLRTLLARRMRPTPAS